jgi:hypothetical protein
VRWNVNDSSRHLQELLICVMHMSMLLCTTCKRHRYHSILFVDLVGQSNREKNHNGFRITPVYLVILLGKHSVQKLLSMHLEVSSCMDKVLHPKKVISNSREFIRSMMENGRVGAILFNMWRNTLEDPVVPPEFPKE